MSTVPADAAAGVALLTPSTMTSLLYPLRATNQAAFASLLGGKLRNVGDRSMVVPVTISSVRCPLMNVSSLWCVTFRRTRVAHGHSSVRRKSAGWRVGCRCGRRDGTAVGSLGGAEARTGCGHADFKIGESLDV